MHRTGADQLQHPGNGARESRGDAGENDDRNAVAQAPLSHLLAEPHQEHGAGHQRDDGGEAEHQPRVDHQSGLRLERDRDAGRLEKREKYRPVARVLRDLALARLAFFLELLQLRGNRGHELHDDRGRDIGHDAEREDGEARKRPAREHVEQAENPALLRLKQLGELDRIDARHRNVRADPENDQRQKQKRQALLQVAEPPGLAELRGRGSHLPFAAFLALRPRPVFLCFALVFPFALVFGFALVFPFPLVLRAAFAFRFTRCLRVA